MADTPKRKKPDAPQGAQGRLPPKFEADTEPAEEEEAEKDTVEILDSDGIPAAKPKLPATHRSTISKRGDLLQAYLSEVRRHPLLDPEEEKELAIRYTETQDPEAAARLVTANLRLVVKLAFQYHRQWANVLDLIQEGNVGLVEALSRYDPYRGVRFSSYAQYWIRAMILRFLMDNYRMVRLGSTRHGRKLFFSLKKEKARLEAMGINPTTKAVSDSLQIPEKEIVNVDQHLRAPALSLHAPLGGDEGRSLSDVISDKDVASPEDMVGSNELGAQVRDSLEAFAHTLKDDREVTIWYERLVAEDSVSLAVLGERYGVSKERIRQVEARIKRRLKIHLRRELGDEIDFEFNVPAGG
jgi:RNA polymerase sigma-32 factor